MLFIGRLARNRFLKVIFAFWVTGLFVLWGAWLPFSATCPSKSVLQLAYAQDYAKPFVFGPYIPLSPGKYQVTLTLKVEDNKTTQPVANLEVIADKAQRVFASRAISAADFKFPGRYQSFDLQFETTAGARDFEFRISYCGSLKLWAEKISITQLQGYSEQEAMGTDLIRGYSKNKIIPETESFLKDSKQKEMRIDDKRLSRRMGYLVSDPQASCGRAWLVKPSMVQITDAPAPAAPGTSLQAKIPKIIRLPRVPKMAPIKSLKISNPWMLFVFGLITGYMLALISALVYRRILFSRLRQLRRRLSSWTLKDIKTYALRLGKRSTLIALAVGIIISVYSENLVLFGFVVKGAYLFVSYVVLSVVWNSDPRALVAVGLVLLVSSSLSLTLGQEQWAERAAIYVYYFLILGTIFQLVEHAEEDRQVTEVAEEVSPQAPGNRWSQKRWMLPRISLVKGQAYVSGEGPSRLKLNKIKRLVIAVAAVFLLGGVTIWGVFFQSSSRSFKMPEYLGKPETGVKRGSRTVILGEQVKERKSVANIEVAETAPEAPPLDKSKIKVEVLNGNGLPGEAGRIGSLLRKCGYNLLGVENSDKFDYPQTIIRHKPGEKYRAELVAKEIGSAFVVSLSEDLPGNHRADIVIILGKEKVDNSSVKVQVLNGNGMRGEAARISKRLKLYGFNTFSPKDAERDDYSRTIIRHKPAQKDIARLVASEISDSYPASLEESLPSDSSADIVVILGRDKI